MISKETVNTVRINGVNTAGQTSVSTFEGNGVTAVKTFGEIENQLNKKVKVIRSDNGTKFKNKEIDEFYGQNGIKKEYSVTRTPQQNGVTERKNRTLIEATRTMLADSLLSTIFWAEVVNTACYILNKVLVTKPHNKTPYELIIGRPPGISFIRPFGCPVTILNTLDPLGKFDGKAEEGFLVGYSVNKAFRVFNTQTRKVEQNLHVNFLENKPNVAGQVPNWLFDIDSLANSMNYQLVTPRIKLTKMQVTKKLIYKSSDDKAGDNTTDDAAEKEATEQSDDVRKEFQEQYDLETNNHSYADESVGAKADFKNMEPFTVVSHIPTTRIHSNHPKAQVIRDPMLAVQTKGTIKKSSREHVMISYI
nr:ribonuclease H-like domain-containing protein [Tanacetum cinerariifolium]